MGVFYSAYVPDLKSARVANVLDYGAVADETTDCTAAVQAAATALTSGGVLYFPRSVSRYYIASQVSLTDGTIVMGAGEGAEIYSPNNVNTFVCSSAGANITFIDVCATGPGTWSSQAPQFFVHTGAAGSVSLTRCRLAGYRTIAKYESVAGDIDLAYCDFSDFEVGVLHTGTDGVVRGWMNYFHDSAQVSANEHCYYLGQSVSCNLAYDRAERVTGAFLTHTATIGVNNARFSKMSHCTLRGDATGSPNVYRAHVVPCYVTRTEMDGCHFYDTYVTFGAGVGATVRNCKFFSSSGGIAGATEFINNSNTVTSAVRAINCEFDAKTTTGPVNYAVLPGASGITYEIENCKFTGGAASGALLYTASSGSYTSTWYVRDCTFSSTTCEQPVYLNSSGTTFTMERCTFDAGVSNKYSVYITNGVSVEINDCRFLATNVYGIRTTVTNILIGRDNYFGSYGLYTTSSYISRLSGRRGIYTANVASAATMNVDAFNFDAFHVTGTTTINTINPYPLGNAQNYAFASVIYLIADGAWSLGTSGNIATAVTPTVNEVVALAHDPALDKWYRIN